LEEAEHGALRELGVRSGVGNNDAVFGEVIFDQR
jgi:hypothetical protein